MQQKQVLRLLFILLICESCSIEKHVKFVTKKENFTINTNKTDDGSTRIAGVCYDGKSSKTLNNAAINVNGVVVRTKEGSFEQSVWPGKYEVKAGFAGKYWLMKRIKINRGEVVTINFFLTDDKDITIYER